MIFLILDLKATPEERNESHYERSEPADSSEKEDDVEAVELYFEKKMKEKHELHERHRLLENSGSTFEAVLRSFEQVPRLSSHTSVLNFWFDNRANYPLLFEVACIVLGVPGTQVSVERSFSQLKFIMNDLRGSLTSENIQNILLVRSNYKLFDENCIASAFFKSF